MDFQTTQLRVAINLWKHSSHNPVIIKDGTLAISLCDILFAA